MNKFEIAWQSYAQAVVRGDKNLDGSKLDVTDEKLAEITSDFENYAFDRRAKLNSERQQALHYEQDTPESDRLVSQYEDRILTYVMPMTASAIKSMPSPPRFMARPVWNSARKRKPRSPILNVWAWTNCLSVWRRPNILSATMPNCSAAPAGLRSMCAVLPCRQARDLLWHCAAP